MMYVFDESGTLIFKIVMIFYDFCLAEVETLILMMVMNTIYLLLNDHHNNHNNHDDQRSGFLMRGMKRKLHHR